MNERTHFFIKRYVSHFILERGCFLCVRGELETGTDCYILTPSSSDHSSTFFAIWLSCSTVGHWGPKPIVWSWFSLRWHPISNWLQLQLQLNLTQAVCVLVIFLFDVYLLFIQVHLVIDSSVESQYVTIIPYLFLKIPHVEFFFMSVSIPLTQTSYR